MCEYKLVASGPKPYTLLTLLTLREEFKKTHERIPYYIPFTYLTLTPLPAIFLFRSLSLSHTHISLSRSFSVIQFCFLVPTHCLTVFLHLLVEAGADLYNAIVVSTAQQTIFTRQGVNGMPVD